MRQDRQKPVTLATHLGIRSISRRALLRFALAAGAALAMPPGAAASMARRLVRTKRLSVIWLSFQECTACFESLTRSADPDIATLLFDVISLDYQHTLQAAAGLAAEAAREQAMAANRGDYLLVVDGAVPTGAGGAYSTIAGRSNIDLLAEAAADAAAVLAIGSCAAWGGIPAAAPNPTGAVPISQLVQGKPLANAPGCPPVPEAIAGLLAHFAAYGRFPALDAERRPMSIYGEVVHEGCPRFSFYQQRRFAMSFDDEGAQRGWCLLHLGCRGTQTHNACTRLNWNGVSNPMHSGHGCLGCAEPGFWDRQGGFYMPIEQRNPPPWRGGHPFSQAESAS